MAIRTIISLNLKAWTKVWIESYRDASEQANEKKKEN